MRRRLAAAGVAAATTTAALRGLRAAPPGGREIWTRRNYRDRPVTLLGGPAVAVGALAGAAVALVDPEGRPATAAAAVAVAGGAAFGMYDDLTGSTHARGFRGHLRALARGELTSGVVKLAGIGVTGLAAAAAGGRRGATDLAIDAGVIAGAANLLNLLDLRPGRALKTVVAAAVPLAWSRGAGGAAAAALGAAAAGLPSDLGERVMIGDGGANALGAALGVSAVTARSRSWRLLVLASVVSLTVSSERVSFSTVIDRTPLLAALDRVGRLPTPGA